VEIGSGDVDTSWLNNLVVLGHHHRHRCCSLQDLDEVILCAWRSVLKHDDGRR
jgi:hypothetical protein